MALYFGVAAPATEDKLLGDVVADILKKDEMRLAVYTKSGVKQVESITVLGAIEAAGAGNVAVVVTAAGLTGSPITLAVAAANDDTAAQVATKVRAALVLDAEINAFFTIGGTGAVITFTKKDEAPNDATLAVTIDDGTSVGLTLATSTNTTAGVEEAWVTRPVVHSQIRVGVGAPNLHTGQEGDFWHDRVADEWYGPKTAGVWPEMPQPTSRPKMIIAIVPALMIVAGALMYALSSNAKVAEIGRILLAAGAFALAFALSGRTVSL